MSMQERRYGGPEAGRSHQTNIENLLSGIIAENMSAKVPELVRLLRDALKDDLDGQDAVYTYFVNNRGNYLRSRLATDLEKTIAVNSQRAASQREAVQEKASMVATQFVSKILLGDFLLPNGKKLKDATFGDCAKAGGWLSAIAKKGKPNQVVGKVLSEADLKKLLR